MWRCTDSGKDSAIDACVRFYLMLVVYIEIEIRDLGRDEGRWEKGDPV